MCDLYSDLSVALCFIFSVFADDLVQHVHQVYLEKNIPNFIVTNMVK